MSLVCQLAVRAGLNAGLRAKNQGFYSSANPGQGINPDIRDVCSAPQSPARIRSAACAPRPPATFQLYRVERTQSSPSNRIYGPSQCHAVNNDISPAGRCLRPGSAAATWPARICPILPDSARLCPTVPSCARLCPPVPGPARFCRASAAVSGSYQRTSGFAACGRGVF